MLTSHIYCVYYVSEHLKYYSHINVYCIHNIIDYYNASVRVVDLVSHTNYVVCVLIIYISGGTYSLKSTPNGRETWLEKFFMAILFMLIDFAWNLLQGSCRRNIFIFISDWGLNRGLCFLRIHFIFFAFISISFIFFKIIHHNIYLLWIILFNT